MDTKKVSTVPFEEEGRQGFVVSSGGGGEYMCVHGRNERDFSAWEGGGRAGVGEGGEAGWGEGKARGNRPVKGVKGTGARSHGRASQPGIKCGRTNQPF